MVKGISRQVLVVRPPEPDIFDQAIFILKDQSDSAGITDEQILNEARRAADNYLRSNTRGGRKRGQKFSGLWLLLLGAAAASVVWGIILLFL